MSVVDFKTGTEIKRYTLWTCLVGMVAIVAIAAFALLAIPFVIVYKLLDSVTLWTREVTDDEKRERWKASK